MNKLLIIITIVCLSHGSGTAAYYEDQKNPLTAQALYCLDQINRTDDQPGLDLQGKNRWVDGWYQKGKEAYDRQLKVGVRFVGESQFRNAFGALLNRVVTYYLGTRQPDKALQYLEVGVRETKRQILTESYLYFQQQRVDTLLTLGFMEKARSAAQEAAVEVKRVYDVKPAQGVKDYDGPSLNAYITALHQRIQVTLESGESGDAASWETEYAFVQEAYEKFPGLGVLDVGRIYRQYGIGEKSALAASQADLFHIKLYRSDCRMFVDFSRLFAILGKKELAISVLDKAIEAYQYNASIWKHDYRGESTRRLSTNLSALFSGGYKDQEIKNQAYEYFLLSPLMAFQQPLNAALIHHMLGDTQQAEAYLSQAYTAFDTLDAEYKRWPSSYRWMDNIDNQLLRLIVIDAQIKEKRSQWPKALALYESHIAKSEALRANLPVSMRLEFFRSNARVAYLGAVRCLAQLYLAQPDASRLQSVLAATEHLRARQFLELLGTGGEPARQIDVNRVQMLLPADEAILSMLDCDSHFLMIYLDRTHSRLHFFAKPADMDRRLFTIRNALAQKQEFQKQELDPLSRQLLQGLDKYLPGVKRLHVITDGAWSALPAGILPFGGGLLQDGRVISYLPALSLFHGNEAAFVKSRLPNPSFLVVADPLYKKDERSRTYDKPLLAMRGSDFLGYFQPLPETRDEANAITQVFAGSQNKVLAGEEAVESAIKGMDLTPYAYIHIATHGVLSGDIPDLKEPALVLGWEKNEDGLLTATEVSRLRLNARLTVLSACNTGNGSYFQGEGLIGMGRAFMLAGSRQVVVSLWPVDSQATKELMVRFYRGLGKGLSAERALGEAQDQVRHASADGKTVAGAERGVQIVKPGAIKHKEGVTAQKSRYENPFFWSPFILVSSE